MTNEYNPDGKEIRFIDSHYKDLFHIPDGSCVQIHYLDETVVKPCTFIDEYHTQIGYNVFHICQFAEIMERNGASYMPEPEIMGDEAAWKVGKDRILAVQTCEDGYDYTLLDENYNEIDGGQVDNPELSMIEVRQDILESFGLERRELRAMFYEDVMEQAFEVGRQAVVVNDPIAELAFILWFIHTPMRTATSVRSGKPLKRMPKQRKGSCRLNMSRSPEPLFPLLLKPSMIFWMSICQSMV